MEGAMIQDRGHGGLVFVGFTGIEVPVSARPAVLGGGHETDAWRIGGGLEAAGVWLPEGHVIGHLRTALHGAGITILARSPASDAPTAAHRVWGFLFRADLRVTPCCIPGTEAGEACDECAQSEAKAIDEFVALVGLAGDAARELACMVEGRSAFAAKVDLAKVRGLVQKHRDTLFETRLSCGQIAHRTKVREMLGSLRCAEKRIAEDAKILGV